MSNSPRMRNASTYSSLVPRYLDDPGIPPRTFNQPIEGMRIKPVTPWDRGFVLGETRSTTGSVTTEWYQGGTKLVATHLASNPTGYTYQEDDRYLPWTPTNWDTTSMVNCPLWSYIPPESDADEVLQRCLADAKTRGWDLLTLIAERKKTMNMILDLQRTFNARARRVASALQDRGSLGGFLKGSRDGDALPTWLLARYGLRPLVYDMAALWDRLANELSNELLRSYARDELSATRTVDFQAGFANPDRLPSGWTYTGGILPTNPMGVGRMRVHTQCEMLAGAGVTPLLTNQLTLNPGNTAFELVPWLWVLDHFATVGDAFLAHTPVFDRRVEYLWLSSRNLITASSYASWYGKYAGGNAFPPGSSTTRKGTSHFAYSRETTIRLKRVTRRPVPVSKVPVGVYLNLRLDAAFMVDMVALYNSRHRALMRLFRKKAV